MYFLPCLNKDDDDNDDDDDDDSLLSATSGQLFSLPVIFVLEEIGDGSDAFV